MLARYRRHGLQLPPYRVSVSLQWNWGPDRQTSWCAAIYASTMIVVEEMWSDTTDNVDCLVGLRHRLRVSLQKAPQLLMPFCT